MLIGICKHMTPIDFVFTSQRSRSRVTFISLSVDQMLYAQWVRLIKIYGTPAVYDRILQIHIGVSKTRVYIYFRKLNIKQTKPVCVYIT